MTHNVNLLGTMLHWHRQGVEVGARARRCGSAANTSWSKISPLPCWKFSQRQTSLFWKAGNSVRTVNDRTYDIVRLRTSRSLPLSNRVAKVEFHHIDANLRIESCNRQLCLFASVETLMQCRYEWEYSTSLGSSTVRSFCAFSWLQIHLIIECSPTLRRCVNGPMSEMERSSVSISPANCPP